MDQQKSPSDGYTKFYSTNYKHIKQCLWHTEIEKFLIEVFNQHKPMFCMVVRNFDKILRETEKFNEKLNV